jgi:hypothetical protein
MKTLPSQGIKKMFVMFAHIAFVRKDYLSQLRWIYYPIIFTNVSKHHNYLLAYLQDV